MDQCSVATSRLDRRQLLPRRRRRENRLLHKFFGITAVHHDGFFPTPNSRSLQVVTRPADPV
jgi:hypothetical protein